MKQRLKTVRSTLGFTQAGFAEQLGITQTAYSMIENGYRPLSVKYIKLLCSAFHLSEKWLVSGEGEMFTSSPYEKEFSDIFAKLSKENQEFLLNCARNLLEVDLSMKEQLKKARAAALSE